MSMVASIKAGEAFIEVTAKDNLNVGLGKAAVKLRKFGETVQKIGTSLTAIAGAGLAGFGVALKQFADFGSEINDFSARTGVSTDWAQSLRAGAELGGASMQDLENGIRKMQKQLAKSGELSGMNPVEQFLEIANRISKIEDPTKRAAAAMEAFGKSGTKLLPMMEVGAAGLRRQLEAMKASGLILAPEDVKNADELGDSWDMLKMSVAGVVRLVGASLAPAVIKLVEAMSGAVQIAARWVNENRGLVKGLALATVVLGGLGGVLLFVAAASAIASAALWSVAVTGGAISTVLGVVFSPIGLAIAGVIALTAAFLYLSDGVNVFGQSLEGIFNALASGRWEIAAIIPGQAMLLAFETAWANIKLGFIDFANWMNAQSFGPEIAAELGKGMQQDKDAIVADLKTAQDEFAALMKIAKGNGKSLFDSLRGGDGQGFDNPAGSLGMKALGAQSGFAAARIGQMGPSFDWGSEQKKQTGLLERIADGVEAIEDEGEPEFGE